MNKVQKLELTWVGKNEELHIEPRILVENKELSNISNDPNTENMLIHGDNLLALKALEQKYVGQIKCIYIDPPYNTGAAFEHYDDNLEHSTWLNLMKPRLEILWNLLSDDGIIFVQIDDNEQAYLTVMMDEIFGRKNRNTICVKMSEPTGVKMTHADKRLPKLKEYILMYRKNDLKINQVKIPKDKWDNEYKLLLTNVNQKQIEFIKSVMNSEDPLDVDIKKADTMLKDIEYTNIEDYLRKNNIVDTEEQQKFKYDNAWRILRDVATTGSAKNIADKKMSSFKGNFFLIKTPKNKVYLIKNGYNSKVAQPRIKMLFAEDYLMVNPCDLWLDITTTGLEAEGGVEFKKSKKPEKLLQRCIEIASQKGDFVLDSFLGSGTTACVAHKMGRKWIGIEMGEHAYTHCKVRLDKIIDNQDSGGITKLVNWKGGGGYRFYELAPTLIKEDAFGQPIINPEYNAEMLAAAVAKHEGYFYNPDSSVFWKQSNNKGNSYLFVTTNHVDSRIVETIKADMKEDEFVLIVCKSFDSNCNGYKNIAIKKIPQSLLKNCEFGVDNYNLNIINPPVYEEDEDE